MGTQTARSINSIARSSRRKGGQMGTQTAVAVVNRAANSSKLHKTTYDYDTFNWSQSWTGTNKLGRPSHRRGMTGQMGRGRTTANTPCKPDPRSGLARVRVQDAAGRFVCKVYGPVSRRTQYSRNRAAAGKVKPRPTKQFEPCPKPGQRRVQSASGAWICRAV